MKRLFASFLILIGLMGMASAGEIKSSLAPVVPKAAGEAHPEGNEFMRINHMKLMVHDRDDTVLLGDRNVKYSLKECVACHAVMGPDARPVSVKSDQHFCRTCHEFAAVKIDCFQCHNSLPDADLVKKLTMLPQKDRELAAYLKEVTE